MLLVCVLVALGTFARTFIELGFVYVQFGQFLCGVAACFVVNTLMQFCFNWFHPSSRGLFISVAGVLNVFGGGMGNILPLLFVDNEGQNPDVTRQEVSRYTWATFGVAVLNLILVAIFFGDKPPANYG